MTRNIYDNMEKTFSDVGMYAISQNNERRATIQVKFQKSGIRKVFVHWYRVDAQVASSYSFDAAMYAATDKMPEDMPDKKFHDGTPFFTETERASYRQFRVALKSDEWLNSLLSSGFQVWQLT